MNISGQPVHFFDAEKVVWNVIIRQAKMRKVCGSVWKRAWVTRNWYGDSWWSKNISIGGCGLMIGFWSNWKYKNILVEIANFDPVCVRKTWVRLWLRTDAELRYEKI